MDTETTGESGDRAKLRSRPVMIIDDISAGRIVRVEISKKSKISFREGTAVIAGLSGVPVQIKFFLYANGRVSVREALADDYFDDDLSWRYRDHRGTTSDMGDSFYRNINAAMQKLKLGEVAKMPRPLRWLYLLRN